MFFPTMGCSFVDSWRLVAAGYKFLLSGVMMNMCVVHSDPVLERWLLSLQPRGTWVSVPGLVLCSDPDVFPQQGQNYSSSGGLDHETSLFTSFDVMEGPHLWLNLFFPSLSWVAASSLDPCTQPLLLLFLHPIFCVTFPS